MVLNCLFNPLRFDADVSLGSGGAAVLQQTLDEGDVITIVLVNLRGIPLAEAVGADSLIAQIITDDGKLFLNCSLRDGEDDIGMTDGVA